jgi:hypothetical protein
MLHDNIDQCRAAPLARTNPRAGHRSHGAQCVGMGDEVVWGVGIVEAIIDGDEHPALLLGHHDIDAVLASPPLHPLQHSRTDANWV